MRPSTACHPGKFHFHRRAVYRVLHGEQTTSGRLAAMSERSSLLHEHLEAHQAVVAATVTLRVAYMLMQGDAGRHDEQADRDPKEHSAQ